MLLSRTGAQGGDGLPQRGLIPRHQGAAGALLSELPSNRQPNSLRAAADQGLFF